MPSHDSPPSAAERQAAEVKQIQLVGFRLEDQDYAIPITKIQEIILMKPVTRVPQAPPFIEGLINLRGVVIPVINLRRRFSMPHRDPGEETRIIVLNLHQKTVGCIVDAVTRVMRLSSEQTQPAPTTVLSAARNYISGIANLEDRLLIILDVEKLFDPAELALDSGAS
jgi:purine-binding chemotaxis protein CheW